jgi:hypothetical protein
MKRMYSLLSLGVLLGAISVVLGAKPEEKSAKPKADEVELFAAMDAGDIEVKLIPKDSTTGTVLITNKTKKPLAIKLPDAFAGVPVAAQFGGGGGGFGGGGIGGGGIGGGGIGGGGGSQGLGGGFGGGGGGFGGGGGGFGGGGGGLGGGGGFFNVAPEKVGKVKVTAVCLEHGKDDPNPRIPYELRPIESFAKDQKVIELVKMLGRGEIDQHSAQAAAWHLANGMSWNELAAKIGRKHLNGATEPYFTAAQLQKAMAITRVAEERAEKIKTESPGEQAAKLSSASQQ